MRILRKVGEVIGAMILIGAIGFMMAYCLVSEDPWFYGEKGAFSKPLTSVKTQIHYGTHGTAAVIEPTAPKPDPKEETRRKGNDFFTHQEVNDPRNQQ